LPLPKLLLSVLLLEVAPLLQPPLLLQLLLC
jgi:hypothetical protein